MSEQYDQYLREHISCMRQAFDWIEANFHEVAGIFPAWSSDFGNILWHDDSKTDAEEYDAYDQYFYGENKDDTNAKEAFNLAWLHHIHNNPHHWQHWLLFEDDPKSGESYICLQMPLKYVIEMICDWWSFSWRSGNLYEIFDWYEKHKKTIKLHEETRKQVEDILGEIRKKLDEIKQSEEEKDE